MSELRIIDVDENGNELPDIDWAKWRRVRTEEVWEGGKLSHLISHCELISQAEINAQKIADLKRKLADTDYVAAKIAEGAATREDYADVIAQRQEWRDEINALR